MFTSEIATLEALRLEIQPRIIVGVSMGGVNTCDLHCNRNEAL
jgi:predicted acylesterase/phospholipase RssA